VCGGDSVVDTAPEQAAVHAAEGVGECTRKTGRCAFDGGPGVTDGVTGVAKCLSRHSPVL